MLKLKSTMLKLKALFLCMLFLLNIVKDIYKFDLSMI